MNTHPKWDSLGHVETGHAETGIVAPDKRNFSEMTVLITGASRGIGRAVAETFGRQGSRVVVNYRERGDSAAEVVAAIVSRGGQAKAVQADISTVGGAELLARAAIETYGRVDVLVNNATPRIETKPFLECIWDDVDQYWNAYVRSAFTLAQSVLPSMKKNGFGRIIHVLSGYLTGQPPAQLVGYITAKSALWGFTRALAVEAAPWGVTVNAISPATVENGLLHQLPGTSQEEVAKNIPLRRAGKPDDVANAVLFLAGKGGNFVTGANIPVAGGEVM